MNDTAGLRALISEYGQLEDLSGLQKTPQARGIRFNGLFAEMLRCWGIEADVSTARPGNGEIDVTFTLAGERYLVEAKWEKGKTNADPLFKLHGRLRQRLRGPIGIFMSMAGYTSDAVDGLNRGSQLEMLLFDRSHFEAMLSGLVPPQELIQLAHDRAAFRGEAYASLFTLLVPRDAQPTVSYGAPAELGSNILVDPEEGSTARVLFTMASSAQIGVAYGENGALLITQEEGIAEVIPAKEEARWKVPLRGCHRSALQDNTGAVFFARRHGIARLTSDDLTIIGGGLHDSSCLFSAYDDVMWTLDSDPGTGTSPSMSVTKLGDRLGRQERHSLPVRWDPVASDAVWLDEHRLAIAHRNSCSVLSLDGEPPRGLHAGGSNCSSILRVDEQTVLIADDTGLKSTDLVSGRHAEVVGLTSRPLVANLAPNSTRKILLASYYGLAAANIAVIEVELVPSISSATSRAFGRADSGNTDEYVEQVNRIARRKIPMPEVTEPQLNALFNSVGTQVYEVLAKRILAMAEQAGLTLDSGMFPRPLDGWPPPEYGGSANQPRWRLSGTANGPWLEASIGVSHRVWPKDNLNDLIITLIVARMSEKSQHTLLTRFAPCALEDPSLQDKISAIIAAADAVLPAAFAEFRALPSPLKPE